MREFSKELIINDDRIEVLAVEGPDSITAKDVDEGAAMLSQISGESKDLTRMLALLRRFTIFVSKICDDDVQPILHIITADGHHGMCFIGKLFPQGRDEDAKERNEVLRDFFLQNDVVTYCLFAEANMVVAHHYSEEEEHRIMERKLTENEQKHSTEVGLFRVESGDYACLIGFEFKDDEHGVRIMDTTYPKIGARVRKSLGQSDIRIGEFLLTAKRTIN